MANNFENQYATKLDLMQFCTIDDSLAGVAGDTVKINTYTATDGTETLAMGEGNTRDIEVSYETKDYTIELLQNRFSYFDHETLPNHSLYDKIKGKSFKEQIGLYYMEDRINGVYGSKSNVEDVNKIKKRIITYTVI